MTPLGRSGMRLLDSGLARWRARIAVPYLSLSADGSWLLLGAAAVALLYAIYYFLDPAVPGNRPEYPLGWWGWFDQGQYITSARALAALDLSPGRHWYPLGYALVGAPLVRLFPAHAYFFVDLACILVTYFCFCSVARRIRIYPFFAVPLFVVTVFGSASLGQVWAEPWNSSLSAALIWALLAVSARLLDPAVKWSFSSSITLGLLAASLLVVRPTDVLLSAIALLTVLGTAVRRMGFELRYLGWVVCGGLIVVVPYLALYLRIYGAELTSYMKHEREIGFVFNQAGWKTYELLLSPRPWFPNGEGILARFPWLVLGLTDMLLLPFTKDRSGSKVVLCLICALTIPYWFLFFCYLDLLPSGLWAYHNIHYLKWTFPGLGLLAIDFLRRAISSDGWRACGALAIVTAALCIRVVPVPATSGMDSDMVQFSGRDPGWAETYFGAWTFRDDRGTLRNPLDVRAIPDSQGVRVLALRRPFMGAVTWLDMPASLKGPDARWRPSIEFGYPCWLPPYPCDRLPPEP